MMLLTDPPGYLAKLFGNMLKQMDSTSKLVFTLSKGSRLN